MRLLLVLRHAKSSWDDSSLDDHERPLNRRGRRDAPRMGDLVREQQLVPDLIVSSDAERARLTAEAVAEAAGYRQRLVMDPRLYLASAGELIAVLQALPSDARTVMIVGHNPGLEELVSRLTGAQHDLPTGALAAIQLPVASWNDVAISTAGRLLNLWRPKDRP